MSVELYKHNQETYDRMIEMFKTNNRVGVVQPTGTGKSFLMLKWIEDNMDKYIVLLSPSNILFDQLYQYAEECDIDISHVNMQTYQKLDRVEDFSIELLDADMIILDEFHRCGAEEWGKSVDVLLDSHTNAKVLGLTATPVRYLDKSKNMAEKIFNNILARYMTLGEAVEQEILPVPKYIPVWYDYNNKLTKYQKDINSITNPREKEECERLLWELKNHLENSYGAEDIFKDNMPNDHGKYIVFCKHGKHIKKMKKKMHQWLKGINSNIVSYTTTSNCPEKDKEIQRFIANNDESCIKLLFSINRLNEGLHVKGIDGVIMLRPTSSGIIYLQQMGRAFATNGKTPLIFDMVNNYQNVKAIDPDSGEYYNIFEKQIYGSILVRKNTISDRIFGIFEDMKTFNEIFIHIESKLYNDYDDIWDKNFEDFKLFIKEFNRLPHQLESYNGKNIGTWYSIQKSYFMKGKLKNSRKEKLESIGMILKTDNRDELWEENFEIFKSFIDNFNRFPIGDEIYKGKSIARWYKNQNRNFNKGKLSKKRQEKLESLGVIFGSVKDLQWNDNFEILKMVIKEFNRTPIYDEIYNGHNIGRWYCRQLDNMNNGKLNSERIEKLKSIGITPGLIKDKRWDNNFEILKLFIKEFDRLPNGNDTYMGKFIGKWLIMQKVLFNKNKLSKERQDKLKSMNIVFQKFEKDKRWNDNFETVKMFVNEFGKLPIHRTIYNNKNIGSWLATQKTRFKEGKLSKERQEKLESIGVVFKKKDEE